MAPWRNAMGKNPVVAVIALVVLAVALFIIIRTLGGGGGTRGNPSDAFWYDLQTGKLFPHEGAVSPIEAPSGGQGVRAYVFACKSCDDDNDRFIGYLERYTAEGKRIFEAEQAKNNPMARMAAMSHLEVRREKDTEWLLHQEEIPLIKEEIKQRCGGKDAIICKTFQD